MFDPSSFANSTPLAHADTSRDVFPRGDLVENTVEVEDKSHEEDNDESEEVVEDLNKALDLEFDSGVGTDALFHVTYAEKNSITNINETIKKD
ncbi:hypothetical protein TNCV_590411 [Trichonephila clavipes]|nr:hypothetical protein TNCV_590411 [Trichonephila clavipes]